MRKNAFVAMVFFFLSCGLPAFKVNVGTRLHDKMKLLIALPDDASEELCTLADIVRSDLSFSDQFDVSIKKVTKIAHKKDISQFSGQGFPLVVYLAPYSNGRGYEWRLYNSINARMIKGKKCRRGALVLRGYAHMVADMIWPELTSKPGLFSSKIAYCKEIERPGNKKNYKYVYIADYDGSNEQVIVKMPTVAVCPYFNRDPYRPLLFYSQFTDENVELMVTDMRGKSKVISTFDGVNMQPTFSEDGKKVAYCASKGTGSCQIYYYENKKLEQITDNEGNNISPTMTADGKKIYFCSDFEKRPSIYCFDRITKKLERITTDASSMSPVYNATNDRLAYCKKKDGFYQLFVYDCATKEQIQYTTDAGHKNEPSWSACGNYLLYAVERNKKQSLEVFNVLSNTIKSLKVAGNCSYPTWSMRYKCYATVS